MRVLITGATGTIGLAVADALSARGDSVVALSRDPERGQRVLGEGVEVHPWAEPETTPPPAEALAGADAVVNLLGEPVAQRWSESAKTRIRESRVHSTRMLVGALTAVPPDVRPRALISQSATGYYGPRGDAPLDENASPGDDFLAGVTQAWEGEAAGAGPSPRVVCTRTGVVLSPSGGALAKMLPPFRLGLGGRLGSGRQWMSWIHAADLAALFRHLLGSPVAGPVNGVAPAPVTNAEFTRALAGAVHRPAIFPVPEAALRLLFGDMADVLLASQRVLPQAAEAGGFRFQFPRLEPALADLLK